MGQAKEFTEKVSAREGAKAHIITFDRLPALEKPQVLFYPGPDIAEVSFQRSNITPTGWSLCGITHTTSSARAMDAIASIITAPIQTWDAIICTSVAVKKHVENILQNEITRLEKRLGLKKVVLPQLPIIPLGINAEEFESSATKKAEARERLKIGKNEIVVLYVGRLSFHAKAHPVAMYSAIQAAAKASKKSITLIECGWFANNYTKKAFNAAASSLAPNINVIHIDGRKPDMRKLAWLASDIFCSLSDNIQETFGITPIEAMAAGLPVIVSEWNGYKDTVRHGRDGFLVKTVSPQSGLGGDLALRHAMGIDNYDYYCGYSCMHTAVDSEAASEYFKNLIENDELRSEMGESGRQRVAALFDWKAVIPRYEDLWKELNLRRTHAKENVAEASKSQIWPARMDPFSSFSHYPSSLLTLDTVVGRTLEEEDLALKRLEELFQLEIISFAKGILLPLEELSEILCRVDPKGSKVKTLIEKSGERASFQLRALVFLCKLGLIRVINDQ